MIALVTGGAASGKSALAEDLACRLPGPRVYLATMVAEGEEGRARVERHRAQRAHKGFARTVERPRDLAGWAAGLPRQRGTLFLDDLGNLVANTLFGPQGPRMEPDGAARVLRADLDALLACWEHVVVVGVEAGCGGVPAGMGGYVRALGDAACHVASRADCVAEVACGVPHVLKGRLP